MTKDKRMHSALVISLALHLFILLILAFIYYTPVMQKIWHEFDWLSPDISEIAPPEPQGITESAAGIPKPAEKVHTTQESEVIRPIQSPLIESPVISDAPAQSGWYEEISHTQGSAKLSAVGDIPSNSGGASPYNAALVSGAAEAYIIRQNPPKISPLSDDEVLIDFQLSESGRVLMNTVNVLSYKESAHWEAIRKVMPSWRFGFKGQYNSQRVYRIRIVFRVN